ncbi:hypothetical protein PsYK624_135250 [Phanerochaete sordida]|uniref:Uncharacterized protein n=1 Tax=Phanerochaete sordida TaxID=48140 RepID=A0A9P3GPW3_9APHY|nr:hypothetical protein PsYK624_135250 [Phanerochaete sordida]
MRGTAFTRFTAHSVLRMCGASDVHHGHFPTIVRRTCTCEAFGSENPSCSLRHARSFPGVRHTFVVHTCPLSELP